jgi:MFS family permease
MEVAVYDGDGQLLTGSLAVFQTPAGFLVDRIGARRVLIAGSACRLAGLSAR